MVLLVPCAVAAYVHTICFFLSLTDNTGCSCCGTFFTADALADSVCCCCCSLSISNGRLPPENTELTRQVQQHSTVESQSRIVCVCW